MFWQAQPPSLLQNGNTAQRLVVASSCCSQSNLDQVRFKRFLMEATLYGRGPNEVK